ncbi:MAG TPA: amino acid transporter [Pseudonocardiaceae bacterium]|nr:amino acid transporter [Pseudonocardiaceae bacterium]
MAASGEPHRHRWWQVMCLTGVDYFSTLGYQPGIAALAAGVLSPVATLVLVLVTLAGALPVYRYVAGKSPHGEGSLAMLERLLPRWRGKLLVLVLLGFAATDFMITMTLSAADATAHLVENPLVPEILRGHTVAITVGLLALLGGVFLAGFSEAIGVAVGLVAVYLALNLVIVVTSALRLASDPGPVWQWSRLLISQYPNPLIMVAIAALVFPKLALGLSGFETGVAVMPLIQGDETDTEERPQGRIRDTRTLLATAAVIMSVFLLTTSVVTTVLIPPEAFKTGGPANGRALAYLAHQQLGTVFGTLYDLSTITILWFAGASAMAGLLNLVPRYLPRYGMAPHWARRVRPLVGVFTAVAFGVTILFHADVDAQGGAYATGVLVLITSAALAATLSVRRAALWRATAVFAFITAIFGYTTIANIIERPEGVKIAGCFIGGIIVSSFLSRAIRAFELRVTAVHLDPVATALISETGPGPVRIVANEPDAGDVAEYHEKTIEELAHHHIPDPDRIVFLEITLTDPSEFETELHITGLRKDRYRVLRVAGPSVPNAIAALLLHIQERTGTPPHIYFDWTEGNPILHLIRYLLSGSGEIAPVTREILRRSDPVPEHRPVVHVA